ncbi:MAG TPA: IS66 family transposase [Kutzneria sp.]
MQAGDGRPSYDDLAALVVRQAAVIEELRAEVAALRAENAELRRRLDMNSSNSSKPPSSDSPFVKPDPKSLRGKSGRKPGGQTGHPGSTLAQVATPDEIVRHEPAACGGCGGGLADAAQIGMERRQVFDLPPITVRVTEHQLITRRCACGITTCAPPPDGVAAPAQYGPRVTAIVLYLYVGQFLSKQRTAQALAELFGAPVSPGTVATMTRRAATGLSGFLGLVRDRIAEAAVAHFDETGFRVEGRLHWVHSASTGKYSLIVAHGKRGRVAMDAAGVLPSFTGVAVHDAWAPYDCYPVTHALCNAHLLRELVAVTETAPVGEGGWCWARQVRDGLLELKTLVSDAVNAGRVALDPTLLAAQVHVIRSAAVIAVAATGRRRSPIEAKHHALARRILDRQADYLRFATDFRVPFDNNAAEREIRMVRLREKVSGCMRTLAGARDFAAIRSYLATAAKHHMGFLHVLAELVAGRPWLPITA